MDGNRLFRRDGQKGEEGAIVLYVRETQDYLDFCLGIDGETAESLSVRIRGRSRWAIS